MPVNCSIPCNRPPPTDHREGTGPEDSGWFTVVGRSRTPVESRTGDDTAHRAVTAVQRCPSGSRSARSAGTPWANSRPWLTVGDCGRAVTVLPNAPRTRSGGLPDRFHTFVLQNASDPRQWRGPEVDGPAIGRSPELLQSAPASQDARPLDDHRSAGARSAA